MIKCVFKADSSTFRETKLKKEQIKTVQTG